MHKKFSESFLCFLCLLCLFVGICFVAWWLSTDGRVATNRITVTIAVAVSITFANADNGFAPVGRRDALSWFAFGPCACDCTDARWSDVVRNRNRAR